MRFPALGCLLAALAVAVLAASPTGARGADLKVSKGEVIVEDGETFIEVDVAWRLSWRNDTNWDAAWIFAKFNADGSTHLKLVPGSGRMVRNRNPGAPGAAFQVSPDSLGSFVYRAEAADGRGTNHWTLRWQLAAGAAGASDVDPGDLPATVDVYGIEMVYVPEGPFAAGDPAGVDGPSNAFFAAGGDSTGTYRVTSSGAIPVCSGDGSLCYTEGGGDQAGPIPAAFPNGYDAFYLMKYKVTQGQYADFLNTLSDMQTANRAIHGGRDYRGSRGTIVLEDGTYRARRPDRACNFLGWRDAAAFADWAALRPYTELEYEKAARGPAEPVPNEFAWGTTSISHGDTLFAAPGITARQEDGTEFVRGNANYNPDSLDGSAGREFVGGDGGQGPLRVDVFETRAHRRQTGNVREASGAGYYGAIGLTGGLFERVVSVASERGRQFEGSHGNGSMSYSGLARNMIQDWPNRQAEGLALRARNYAFSEGALPLAERGFGSYAAHYRAPGMGFRAARTAP
jgi:formylglycine-generating enzyme required for sulfatase activity